jgi:maleate cis-trans isomerase
VEAPLRLGFLYPGYAAEDDYPRLAALLSAPATAHVVHTALGEDGDAHTISALRDMGARDRLAAGVDELRAKAVAAVVWACTSGSFVYGWDGAHAQVRELAERAALPASSTSLAFVHALRALGLNRVAVAATYPHDVAQSFVEFLADGGVAVCDVSASGIMTASEAGGMKEEDVLQMLSAADRPDAEAILVPDTALHTVGLLPRLEQLCGKPVLTANQVSMWEALRLAGRSDVHAPVGRLFTLAPDPANG